MARTLAQQEQDQATRRIAHRCIEKQHERLSAQREALLEALEAGVTAIGEAMIDEDLDSEGFRDLIALWLDDARAAITAVRGEPA